MVVRVGVMGGTFDPIHHGHLSAASDVCDILGLSSTVFVPAGAPWQKSSQVVASAEDRCEMVKRAVAKDCRFQVSRADIDRVGPTYSVDTLVDLRTELGPDVDFSFILGADALAGLAGWHEFERLAQLCKLVAVNRPGHPVAHQALPNAPVTFVDAVGLEISSTQCRQRVRDGRSVRYLVPDAVAEFITDRGLYR